MEIKGKLISFGKQNIKVRISQARGMGSCNWWLNAKPKFMGMPRAVLF
jgi:hypothetical protein